MKKVITFIFLISFCQLGFAAKLENKELAADLTKSLNQAKASQELQGESLTEARALVKKYYPAFVKTGAVEAHIANKLAQDPSWELKKFYINKSNDLNWVVFINDERIPLNGKKTYQTFNIQLRLEDAMDVFNNPKLEADRKKIEKLSNAVWNYMATLTKHSKDDFKDNWNKESDVYLGLDSVSADRTVSLYIYDTNEIKPHITDKMTSGFYFSPDKVKTDINNRYSNKHFEYEYEYENGETESFINRPAPTKYALKNNIFFMSSGLYLKIWTALAFDQFRQFSEIDPLCYDYEPTAKVKFKYMDIAGKKHYLKCVPMPKDGGQPIRPYEGSWQVKPKVKTWNLDDF